MKIHNNKEDIYQRVSHDFNKQGLMETFKAELLEVEKGKVKISCNYHKSLSQHHQFFRAGVITSLADNACGFAALTMMDENLEVLTVEFKVNFLKPAKTDKIIAVGTVVQAGKTLSVCEGIVYDAKEKILIAKMSATMISLQNKS